MIVLFVDIQHVDGMVDQYCLNFLFIILVYIQTIYFLKYRSIDNLKVSWIAPFIQLELPKIFFLKWPSNYYTIQVDFN